MIIDIEHKIVPVITPVPGEPGLSGAIETSKDWDELMSEHKGDIQTIELRSLDVAQAMSVVTGELKYLHTKTGTALLFVLRDYLPVSFLDKLADEKFDYHIKVIADGEVRMLIFQY